MIKAVTTQRDGTPLLIIGLSHGNFEKFRADPDSFIPILGKKIGIPMDVIIFSGRTEAEMVQMMGRMIGPDTDVHIDPKLKS